jgi:LPS export ABC transporter protein LptC
MKKMLFAGASLFLLSVLIVYLNQEKDAKIKLRPGDNSYMDDVSITQKKAGVVKWMLSAKKAIFLTGNDVKLDNLKIIFPEKELTLTSNGGMYDIENRNLKIDGNINAFTMDYEIVASTLFWDSSKNEIVSDEKVKIVGKKFFAEGDNLTATTDKATLNKNVRAVFYGK